MSYIGLMGGARDCFISCALHIVCVLRLRLRSVLRLHVLTLHGRNPPPPPLQFPRPSYIAADPYCSFGP